MLTLLAGDGYRILYWMHVVWMVKDFDSPFLLCFFVCFLKPTQTAKVLLMYAMTQSGTSFDQFFLSQSSTSLVKF